MQKVLKLICLIMLVVVLIGCDKNNNETDEERLQRRIRETEQDLREAQKEYNDTQKTINDYDRYRKAVENAKK